MARIYKGRDDPGRLMRRTRRLMLLCWPLALLSLALTGLFVWQCGERLLALADAWRESFTAWATSPGLADFQEAWHRELWEPVELLLRGLGWALWGLTLAAPTVLGIGLAILLARLFGPAVRQYRQLRAGVTAVKAAMKLLSRMHDNCHIFMHRRFVFEGNAACPELILVSPGGVVVMEVSSLPGIIEGCVTDTVLMRRFGEGEVEKMRNPARQVVGHVTRLSNYLASQDISVWVAPCVLFVHPEASAYVYPPEDTGGRRTRISSCIVTDAASFWEDVGRQMTAGRTLPQELVDRVVHAIRKAPRGR